jgi:hypothetical protein
VVVGSIFCHRSLSAFLRKKIGEPKEEIGNLNGFEYMYLSDLKVPYFWCLSSISIKVISMGKTIRNQPGKNVPAACLKLKADFNGIGDKLPSNSVHTILKGFAKALLLLSIKYA